MVAFWLVGVPGGHLHIDRHKQRLGIAEVAVEIDLGE